MSGRRRGGGLIAGLVGAILMGWFIYALLSSAGCTGAACAGVSNLSAAALPAGLVLVVGGAFTGGGFLVVPALFLAIGAGSLAAGIFHGMPDMPAFPWWFGGLFVAAGLAPFLLGRIALHVLLAKERLAEELVRTGVKGVGTIVSVADTGVTINDNPRILIKMRIDPVDGSAPVERSKKATVSRVAIPRAGDRFPAWFDRNDPDKWLFGTDVQAHASAEVKDLFARARAAAPAPSPTGRVEEWSAVEELAQLNALRKDGALTDAEFAEAKARLLPRIGR